MRKLFHVYNKGRKKEHAFLEFLEIKFPDIEFLNEKFFLTNFIKTEFIEIEPVIEFLAKDKFLPEKRKNLCVSHLEKLNLKEIKPFKSINNISVDFTLISDERTIFFELHENQHKSLSVGRPERIYGEQNNEYFVPRFLVRLLRDIWRWQNLENYKIIWYDWFFSNYQDLSVNELISPGKYEFCFPNSFNFNNFGA